MHPSGHPYSPSLEELRRMVDARLFGWLERKVDELPEAESLIEVIASVLRAGGKRLRPAFCYWGFRAGGANDDGALTAAAGLELLHTFAIVHDDIMDSAESRRGSPTVHASRGLDVALLVGDLSLVLADAMFMSAPFPPGALLEAFGHYSRMREQVIAGQYLDLTAVGDETIDEARARRIAVLKSGRYTIEEPLKIGAALAEASPEVVASLTAFGAPLGEAFQLNDDVIGIFGSGETGKPVDSDIREGKRNLLYVKTRGALNEAERERFVARWGAADLTGAEVDELRSMVEASGARAATEALAAELTGRALAELGAGSLDPSAAGALEDLARIASGGASQGH